MLKQWFQGNQSPIGLDIGHSCLRMIQFAGPPQKLTCIASGAYELPSDLPMAGPDRQKVLVTGCRKMIENAPFVGKRVVSCLPVDMLQYKNIRLPKMPAGELQQAVEWEASERMQLLDEPHQVQFVNAGDVRHGDEVRDELIVMAAQEQVLREHIDLLTECGLSPVSIDAQVTALARCFSRQFRRDADKKVARLFVDIGLHSSKVIIANGLNIAFFKLINIGGAKLNERIAEHLDLSTDDASDLRQRMQTNATDNPSDQPLFGSTRHESVERAVYESIRTVIGELAREIGLCMRYYSVTFRGNRPQQLYLVGGESREPMLATVIANELDVEVNVAEPLFGVDLSASQIAIERRGLLPEWALATGLALRQTTAFNAGRKGAA